MKYVFIEKYRAEFSIKIMCRVLQVARRGWYVWRLRSHQSGKRQQFRVICDATVRKAFTEAKQRYGAPRLADEQPEYNIKPFPPASVVRGCGRKLPGSSARSAIMNMVCLYQIIC